MECLHNNNYAMHFKASSGHSMTFIIRADSLDTAQKVGEAVLSRSPSIRELTGVTPTKESAHRMPWEVYREAVDILLAILQKNGHQISVHLEEDSELLHCFHA